MNNSYTMDVYKRDKRTKTGEKMVCSILYPNTTAYLMSQEIRRLYKVYPMANGYRIEYDETYKTVKNLMTGKEVKIEKNTPRCCDPSSELYWTM